MKRSFALILIFAIMLSAAACSSGSSVNTYRDDNGNMVVESERGANVIVEKIPYSVPYNAKDITIASVEFYENQTAESPSYNLFAVITLDLNDLTEDEGYWLATEDLDVDVYLTSQKNNVDFDSMHSVGQIRWTDTNEMQIVKISSPTGNYRYSFGGSEASVVIRTTQEEMYQYEGNDLHKEEEITYKTSIGSTLEDAENIPQPLHDYVAEWLYSASK